MLLGTASLTVDKHWGGPGVLPWVRVPALEQPGAGASYPSGCPGGQDIPKGVIPLISASVSQNFMGIQKGRYSDFRCSHSRSSESVERGLRTSPEEGDGVWS